VKDLPRLLPPPSPKLLLRLFLAFGMGIGAWYLVRHPYSRLMVRMGAGLLSHFAGIPSERLVLEEGDRFVLDTGLVSGGKDVYRELAVYPVSWNLALLVTLALATPLALLKRSWLYLVLALALLWLSHLGFFCLATYAQVAAVYQAQGQPFQSAWLTRLLGGLAQGYSLTVGPFLPFLLFAPVVLNRPRQGRAGLPRSGQPLPARNGPCPCGSGLKFKRCCGR
jgi:hypothetical protein